MMFAEHPSEAFFDHDAESWVLSRYADVNAALKEPGLVLAGVRGRVASLPDESDRLRIRAETAQALTPARLAKWQSAMEARASKILEGLPVDQPVDLVAAFARPWCLAVAVIVTGVPATEAETLVRLARDVSAAAADPYDQAAKVKADLATAGLRPSFSSGPAPLRDPAFVGLSQTLMSLLANICLALANHPQEYAKLRANPDLLYRAVDELLRYAGVPRTLYRCAVADVVINGLRIAKGERVILRLAAAHSDPAEFPDSERLDLARHGAPPLSLGAGVHSCVGAGLIRIAVAVAIRALADRFERMTLAGTLEWEGGEGFRTPRTLPVRLLAATNAAR